MNFHDHGPAFCGAPNGVRCSEQKHALLRNGLPPKKNKKTGEEEAAETFAESFFRLIDTTTYKGLFQPQNLICRCCRYPII